MQRKQLICSNTKISPKLWPLGGMGVGWGVGGTQLMVWIRKLKRAFPSSSGQVSPRLSSLLSVWTCGHGCECGTHSLCGVAVAKKQWGWMLPEMDRVPAHGSGLPAWGREHLPAESCLNTWTWGVSSRGSSKHRVKKTPPDIKNLAQIHPWLWAAAVNRSRGWGSLPGWEMKRTCACNELWCGVGTGGSCCLHSPAWCHVKSPCGCLRGSRGLRVTHHLPSAPLTAACC